MATAQQPTLAEILSSLGSAVDADATGTTGLDRTVRGAVVWSPGDEAPSDHDVVVVVPQQFSVKHFVAVTKPLFESSADFPVAIRLPMELPARTRSRLSKARVIIALNDDCDLTAVIAAIAGATTNPEMQASRRLASLQRTLTQALAEGNPIQSLTARLSKTCSATAALVDTQGRATHSTGPLPMSVLFDQIHRTAADTQVFSIEGWSGVAVRVEQHDATDAHHGWLVTAARRADYPDAYATSATQVASALVETSLQIDLVARRQERAVRASVLEQALSLRLERHDAELAGRIAGLGLILEEESRVAVLQPLRTTATPQGTEDLADYLNQHLTNTSTPFLLCIRDQSVIVEIQGSAEHVRALLVGDRVSGTSAAIGIGRGVLGVGDIADSYNDALLAIRALRQRSRAGGVMTYEDFDFSTRLFADVGLDEMAGWAEQFLKPLAEREGLLDGLRAYLEHDQNVSSAADALTIHHNSLRYRLAKVEELLRISLRNPAAVSSAYLALTALDLTQPASARPRAGGSSRPGQGRLPEGAATETPSGYRGQRTTDPGVVRGAES